MAVFKRRVLTKDGNERRRKERKEAEKSFSFNRDRREVEEPKALLTNEEKNFIEEYFIDFDPDKAMARAEVRSQLERAGYRRNKFMSNPRVVAAIEERIAEINEDLNISPQRTIRELQRIATSNLKDICKWDEAGAVTMFASDDISDGKASAISEIQTGVNKDGRVFIKKIKMHDKNHAIEMLGRNQGIYKADNAQKTHIDIDIILNSLPFPPEVVDQIRAKVTHKLLGDQSIVDV